MGMVVRMRQKVMVWRRVVMAEPRWPASMVVAVWVELVVKLKVSVMWGMDVNWIVGPTLISSNGRLVVLRAVPLLLRGEERSVQALL